MNRLRILSSKTTFLDKRGAVEEKWFKVLSQLFERANAAPLSGAGSPEGVLAAPVATLYVRTDGGAGTTLYVKESGSGSTGWVAK